MIHHKIMSFDPPNPATFSKRLSVLIVEDETRLRELLSDVIPDMGFDAVAARSAEEALKVMEVQPRDVVLLDLNLPAMSGMELFERLRQRWPAAQVIVLTGFGDLEAARQAIHLDVVDFLTKPSPLNTLEVALDRARRRIEDLRAKVEVPPVGTPPPAPGETLEESERKLILAALERHTGNRTATAQELGISRRTLHYKLAEYQKQGHQTR